MRTKIVCTIGPSSLEREMLLSLHKAGLSIVRLNGSHADLDWHKSAIKLVQSTLPGVPILLDIPGRKIRTTMLSNEPKFNVGDIVILTTDPSYQGTAKVPVNYQSLHEDLQIGNIVLADDGTLRFSVVEINGRDIHLRAEIGGQLRSRKGINVPMIKLNTPLVTDKDKSMVDFACENKVDFIGLSFVESALHVNLFKELIGNRKCSIIAKIENSGGLLNQSEIIECADAIMIDRGDLSVETNLFDVAINQKKVIESAKMLGKPVIVATEMLHTMINNPYPTKAEVSDITNAVIDGCAATMLSGETAAGLFPIQSVKLMSEVIKAAEKYLIDSIEPLKFISPAESAYSEVVSRIVPGICNSLPITKIIALTRSGYAARMISRYNLSQPIIAIGDEYSHVKAFNLLPGVKGINSKHSFDTGTADTTIKILQQLWDEGEINGSDVILVLGVSYPTKKSKLNTLQYFKVSELAATRKW